MTAAQDVPMKVYYFTSEDTAIKILTGWRLRISQFGDMNDPFELAGVNLGTAEAWERLLDHFKEKIGVLCFSQDWQNPLMWSHYGDRHRGCCIEFDLVGVEAREPHYVAAQREFTPEPRDLLSDPAGAEALFDRILRTKFKAWDYEREMRVLVQLEEPDPIDHRFYRELDERITARRVFTGTRCSVSPQLVASATERGLAISPTVMSPTEFKVIESPPNAARDRLVRHLKDVEKSNRTSAPVPK
jgi:hypothetical protein